MQQCSGAGSDARSRCRRQQQQQQQSVSSEGAAICMVPLLAGRLIILQLPEMCIAWRHVCHYSCSLEGQEGGAFIPLRRLFSPLDSNNDQESFLLAIQRRLLPLLTVRGDPVDRDPADQASYPTATRAGRPCCREREWYPEGNQQLVTLPPPAGWRIVLTSKRWDRRWSRGSTRR